MPSSHSRPVSFGVELEFSVASLDKARKNTSAGDTRVTEFPEVRFMPGFLNTDWLNVAAHIKKTLESKGHKAVLHADGYEVWNITEDDSISSPEGDEYSGYKWTSVEISSPKLEFNTESLREIQEVCSILTETYRTNVNQSTGLHVHVSHSAGGFEFHELIRLLTLQWAFEPQLNSLHPAHRVNNVFCQSIRDYTQFSFDYHLEHKRRAPLVEAVEYIGKLKDWDGAANAMLGVGYCAFNWHHLYSFNDWAARDGPNPFKPTIEFRIHEGTLDSAAVLNWIALLAGFTQWCIDASYDEYASLLCKTTYETWEKFGDGKDVERERLHGPIAAEGAFTIVDLLREMGLAKVADYYEKRGFYKVEKEENHRHMLLRGGHNSSLPESLRRDAS